MSTIKVDTIQTRTGSGNITVSNNIVGGGTISGTNITASGTLGVTGNTTVGGTLVNTGLITASAGISIGSGGDTNTLDDYEEGTATVTLNGGSGHPATRLTTTAYYTKIGSTVHINFEFNNVSTTSYSGYISVFGLPFAASSPSGTVTRQVCGEFGIYGMGTFSGDGGLFSRLNEGGTEIILWNNRSNNTWEQVTHNAGNNRYLIVNLTYRTDS